MFQLSKSLFLSPGISGSKKGGKRKRQKNTFWLSCWDTCRETERGLLASGEIKNLHCNADCFTLGWSKTIGPCKIAITPSFFFPSQVLLKSTPPRIGVCRILLKNLWTAPTRSSLTPEVSFPQFYSFFIRCFFFSMTFSRKSFGMHQLRKVWVEIGPWPTPLNFYFAYYSLVKVA